MFELIIKIERRSMNMGDFYTYKVVCDCGSENTEFIQGSDEYSSYGDSERYKCLDCGNTFRVYAP
jgi:transposase-like protein